MLEDGGFLQQFIEFTVGPIIKSAMVQLSDEDSWEEASQSFPIATRLSRRMLIWIRELSCAFIEQEVFQKMENYCVEFGTYAKRSRKEEEFC